MLPVDTRPLRIEQRALAFPLTDRTTGLPLTFGSAARSCSTGALPFSMIGPIIFRTRVALDTPATRSGSNSVIVSSELAHVGVVCRDEQEGSQALNRDAAKHSVTNGPATK